MLPRSHMAESQIFTVISMLPKRDGGNPLNR